MNLFRFIKKCLTDPAAARTSAALVLRSIRGGIHWRLHPDEALCWRLPTGGVLYLERGHSFTHAFWPAVRAFEPELREFLLAMLKPGDTFVDCGSNIGYFSVLAGDLVGKGGRVIAIEANPVTHKLVSRNLAANGLPAPVHCALTATEGEVELFVPASGDDVYSSLKPGGLVGTENVQSHRVPGRRLDSVLREQAPSRVDIIKIDVEGAEMDVLRSATETLEKFRPLCVVEYSTSTWEAFGSTAEMLQQFAAAARYRISRIHPPPARVRPVTAEDWKSGYANLLLSPLEREVPWAGA